MKSRRLQGLIGLCVAGLLSACATTAEVQATGGSRSDGTIKLSFDYSDWLLTVPKVDADRALDTASTRCMAWGYTGAQAFGGQQAVCTKKSMFGGCGTWTMNLTYQCTGNPPSSR